LSNPETFGREEESNQSGSTYSKHSLQELNELLDQAVSHEDYEKAAKLEMKFQKIILVLRFIMIFLIEIKY
jgi:protein-arginine kinase activator protein McsA